MEWQFENVVHWTQETAAIDTRIDLKRTVCYLCWCAGVIFAVGVLFGVLGLWSISYLLFIIAAMIAGSANYSVRKAPGQIAVQNSKRWIAASGMPEMKILANYEKVQVKNLKNGRCFTVPLHDIRQVWSTEQYLILQFPARIQILLQKDAFVQGDMELFSSFLRESYPKVKWKYLRKG